ncbi:MAG: hypothetical protein ACOY93_05150 [Bacillota bacterium]
MKTRLRDCSASDATVDRFLRGHATRELTRGKSPIRSWLVEADGEALFAKWAPTHLYPSTLAKDAAICTAPPHPAVVPLLNLITLSDGILLLFPWVKADPLKEPAHWARFFDLPVAEKQRALCTIFTALTAIVEREWIMEGLDEGSLLYSFPTGAAWLIDFACFHRGTRYRAERELTCGSDRFLPPEGRVRGSWIDQSSNVFALGRYAIRALSTRTDEGWLAGFQGSGALAGVLQRATRTSRHERYHTIRAFLEAFEAAPA